jgi:hypothetical protein
VEPVADAIVCQFAVDLAPPHSKWRHTWRFLIWVQLF